MPLTSRSLTGVLAAALAATGLSAPLAAHADTRKPARNAPEAEITLITGHRVHYVDGPGDQDTVTVDRPADAQGGVQVQQAGGDLYVVPDEAVPLIAADRLDRRLFNVTALAGMGYHGSPPVIVSYDGPAPRSMTGAQVVRALPSVKGAALQLGADPRPFWKALGTARSGPAKVWLDGKARVALKESVPQVGAPRAWAAGLDGTGVKVAVLDTGVDLTHPDLKDRIAESTSFVPGEEVTDVNGHGTHVASTVAGTGAASGGANRGVAPGAELLIGKVLADNGYGQDSWIIAGMEWAAARAGVVSMSLGSDVPDGGTDPMAQAVDTLSAQHGTLFVIAAGNSYGEGTIGAPGSAASALTVGAVDKADERAEFSSMGPLDRTYGLKPDISAPGVGIEAAHSSYNTEADGPYWKLDGTSMATPHVAGAAAILLQRHPGWSGQRLKDALMSSAKQLAYTPFEQGAGRLDVAAAVQATVTATGSVPTAFYDWPHAAGDPRTDRTIAYRNDGDADVTLDLAVSGSSAATLSAPRLTVPARGTAEVTLSIDPAGLEPGTKASGLVTATSGETSVRTAFGAVKERELYDLTLKLRDRDGKPAAGRVVLASFGGDMVPYDVDGERVLRLPPDTYMAYSLLEVAGERADARGMALLVDPETVLDGNEEVVLDASEARPVSASTPRLAERRQAHLDFARTVPGQEDPIRLGYVLPLWYDSLYVSPTEKVTKGTFDYLTRWRFGEPNLTLDVPGRAPLITTVQGGGPLADGRSMLRTVAAGKGAAQDYAGVDARGKAVIVTRSAEVPAEERARQAVAAGAKLLVVVNDQPGRLYESYGEGLPIPVVLVTRDEGAALAGKLAVVEQRTYASYLYDLVDLHRGAVPDRDLTYRARDLAEVRGVYRGATTGQEGGGFRYNLVDGWGPAIGFQEREFFPAERTEWVTTGPGYRWYENHFIGGEDDWEMRQQPKTYRAGQRVTHEWFAPVVRPRLSTEYWGPFRDQGNGMQFNIPPLADGTPGHSGGGGDEYATMSIALFQGEKLIRKSAGRAMAVWDGLPEEAAPYRLTLDVNRNAGRWRTSTRTHTEWGFTSAPVDPEGPYQVDIPMMQLDYDVKVVGPVVKIGLSATTQEWLESPSRANRATLSVSYDDGGTWQRAVLVPTGKGRWATAVRAGSLSLKATASDSKGNTVSQEIIRALVN
ncbi:S8 family peptidase [Nonomuraea rubra]|uniref:Subtilisin family serine protease n=1 Tax=Nonomuraea rubra TaxID=46180 RepID=A0A7X0P4N7_9ACTN|nr:S8 family serine peptidase [Nonomuraea rubra]MBB6555049.1 subtilisin family serine protease [Nonomuraea rubra]